MFETRQCPLCEKILQFKKNSGVQVYHCPSKIEFEGGEARSHYEVEIDNKLDVQHMYVGKYAIDNFANGSKSRIYFWSPGHEGNFRWKFVTEIPQIKPDNQEKLGERIKTLLAYL